MSPRATKKTWIVVLQGAHASVFERSTSGGALKPLQVVTAEPLRNLASWLDDARRARAFERLLLVAPENDATRLRSDLSAPTRALLGANQPDLLRELAAEVRP